MSRAKRAEKEHAIKTALQGCLHELGYEVASWARVSKAKPAGSHAPSAE
jgi:hypothetical protein